MTRHITRPAVATLGLFVLFSLTACTDPNALGAIPSDAPIDTVAEPTPTATPDDWFSAPVTEEPDWDGMSIGGLKINGDQYSYLEDEGEEPSYRNVTLVPFEVGDAEPEIEPTEPFYVEFKSGCRTTWRDPDAKHTEEGEAAPPEFSMFIAESEDAVDGAPISCTTDNMNYEGESNSWAWFTPREFSDGEYFIITKVKDSQWRQVVPFTISTGILDKQGLGLEENGIRHDPRTSALPGEQREINWFELSKVKPKSIGNDGWWDEPKHESFFTVPGVSITGSGTNTDPVAGSFVAVLRGEYRTARTNTWVLGRDKGATSGPEITCASKEIEDGSEYSTRYDCDILPFVDSNGKADTYYLILTSQPGDLRQVVEAKVK